MSATILVDRDLDLWSPINKLYSDILRVLLMTDEPMSAAMILKALDLSEMATYAFVKEIILVLRNLGYVTVSETVFNSIFDKIGVVFYRVNSLYLLASIGDEV
jgi:hypothetical protein